MITIYSLLGTHAALPQVGRKVYFTDCWRNYPTGTCITEHNNESWPDNQRIVDGFLKPIQPTRF